MSTMHEVYDEPNDELGKHECCTKCGCCITCGDCKCKKDEGVSQEGLFKSSIEKAYKNKKKEVDNR